MMRALPILCLSVVIAAAVQPSKPSIPAGTTIRVRTSEAIDSSNAATGRTFSAVVEENATNHAGYVVVREGSTAELAVRSVSNHQLTLDLVSVTMRGRRYAVLSSPEIIQSTKKPGVGKNKRTAKFIGGGAAAGTVIGAIAGGGTGALVGGLVGGGTGAAAQTLTRGKSVHVPAESVLTFRLEQPLTR